MKNLIILLLSFASFACGSDHHEITPTTPGTPGTPTTPTPPTTPSAPGAPTWAANYPTVAWGAVSVDFNLMADKTANVYWIISNKALTLTPAQIKAQATTPTDASIKFHGKTTITANQAKTETVKSLLQNTKYFTYLVAENNTDALLQSEVKANDFKTHFRQDTTKANTTYHSTVENREVRYIIYMPENAWKYYKTKQFPILFFLGGNGEVATAAKPINYFNYNRTLPEYISKGNDVPMIVFTIQHTVQNWNTTLIDEGVIFATKQFNVDPKRIYMSGCSGGGFGCWNYAVDPAHAAKLAAIVPISGGGNTGKACNLKNLPIWAFHNAIDGTVSPTNSKNMIDAVKACTPTKEVKLTYFEDQDLKAHHDCWRRVFNQNDPDWASKTPNMAKFDIYAWLLTKSK